MKITLYLPLCCCLLANRAVAQISTSAASGTFTVVQHQPVSATYSSIEELSSDKIIPNAFTLYFDNAASTYRVYCNVICPAAAGEAVAQQIVLKPSGAIGGTNNQLRLSLTPQLLTERQAGGATLLNYDAIVRHQTTRVPPGNYDFTIHFTIDQP